MLQLKTEKVIRFESKWIGSLSLFVKLTLAISCLYLMFQKDSYQIFDRSPISAVTVKVKQSRNCSNNCSVIRDILKYNCSNALYDVNDFVKPAIENSAVSITTRMIEMKHLLNPCDVKTIPYHEFLHNKSMHECDSQTRCILPPYFRYHNESILKNQPLCWFELLPRYERMNYQALDYVIFIKNVVEFTQLGVVRHNLLSETLSSEYLHTCEYDPYLHPLCPKFRVLQILQILEKDPLEFKPMLFYGSLIEIRIIWKCNFDQKLKFCKPIYQFQRLDVIPYKTNPYESGSSFLTSYYFFQPHSQQLYRIHTHIYNLHILVSVSGEAGRFDLFQTTTSIGSFLGIFGTGTIVCDFIAAFIINFKHVKYDN